MPTLNKHSRSAGHMPNLIPGEVGHNIADDLLWIRVAGKRVPVDLAVMRARAAPGNGQVGAPVVHASPRALLDPHLAPSSVVEGVVRVDAPPVGGYGVPGLLGAQLGSNVALAINDLLVEDFYVASDSLHLSSLNVVTTGAITGNVRLGIVDSAGVILLDVPLTALAAGANETAVDLTLARGAYAALCWTDTAVTLRSVRGFRAQQGWDTLPDDTAVFRASRSANADLSAGLDIGAAPLDDQLLVSPGEIRTVLLAWDLP